MSASRSFPFPQSASRSLRTGLIVLAMCSGLLAVGAPGPAAAGAAHTATCGTLWSTVPSPTPKAPTRGAGLTGVAAISPSDAWAVTTRGIEHSDGGAWKRWRFSVPGVLTGISAVSADDVWAVGFSSPPDRTLTVHWNGSAWSVVTSPNLGVGSNRLSAVSARAADDVWAVGQDFNGAVEQTLIEHWDGSQWSIEPSPNLGDGNNQLSAVTALGANDVWAVGSAGVSYDTSNEAVHWDGTEWQLVATPDQDEVNALTGVSGSASDDVWAVGNFGGHSAGATLLHWDGAEWTDDSTDALPPPKAVVTPSPSDAWAVGNGGVVLHWDGATWGEVSTPARAAGAPLGGVAATSADDVWAVGASRDISPAFGFAEHFDGSTWTTQSTPTNEAHDGELLAIGAIDEKDIWSAGVSRVQKDPVIEHWNGRVWSIVRGPSVDASASGLRSLSVVSASSVWAAGWADQASLIERYDGGSWQVVDVPSVGALRGIAALSDDDVWAAGPGFFLHYDGHAWSKVASPIVNMSGLAAISPNDLYAVSADGSIAHFDGASWNVSYSPHPGRGLFTVTASGADDVWALGHGAKALHFDGASWTRVVVPLAAAEFGSSAVDPTEAWAAGWHGKTGVVQRWDGTAWSQDFTGPRHSRFDAVVALPSGDVWVVGTFPWRYTYVLHGVVCGNQAPVVTPPTQAFVDDSHVVNDKPATVSLHLTWTGSDDDSIAAYQLQMSVNGGDFTQVHLDDPATPAATADVFTGNTYVFRAAATDSHGLTGDWATGPALSPGGSQNPTSRGGSWQTRTSSDDWMGTDQYTRERGAFARFTFTGQGVAWIGPTGWAYGSADVYLDGVKVATVSQYSAPSARTVLFGTAWPAPGPHTITIRSRGTTGHPRTSIDGFFVLH